MILLTANNVRTLRAAFDRAREITGLKIEVLAAWMEMSHSHLEQQLSGQGHLSLRRLLRLREYEEGRAFLRVFWAEMADPFGVEDRDALAQQVRLFGERFQALLDKVQVRMLRAESTERESEKRSA
jgi:hypothetical protein